MNEIERKMDGTRSPGPRGKQRPHSWTARLVVLFVASLASAVTTVEAESVRMYRDWIGLFNGNGKTVEITDEGFIELGSNGTHGALLLERSDGRPSGHFHTSGLSVGTRNFGLVSGTAGHLYVNPSFGSVSALQFEAAVGELIIGSEEAEGGLTIRATDLADSLTVTGAEGTIANRLEGQGLVKAWARLNADGSLLDCYRCDATGTGKRALGTYDINFSPLAADIRDRPRAAVLDTHSDDAPVLGFIGVGNVSGETARVRVSTGDTAGPAVDQAFTVLIY